MKTLLINMTKGYPLYKVKTHAFVGIYSFKMMLKYSHFWIYLGIAPGTSSFENDCELPSTPFVD